MADRAESPRLFALEAEWTSLLNGALGRPLRIHAELGSAMDLAHALAEDGAPAGACVLAEHQRRGRGRLERSWSDSPGDSLLLALILRPGWPPQRAGLLSLAAGLALARAVAAMGPGLELKWPNDCLHRGRKVAGLLTEARLSAGGYRHLVLGMGVNVHQRPGDFPRELRGRADSLDRAAGRRLSRGELLTGFLTALEPLLGDIEGEADAPRRTLLEAWTERWPHRGLWARDESGRRLRLLGPAPDGALRVRGPEGSELLRAGEVTLLLEDGMRGKE